MAGRVVREEREDVDAPGAFMTWKTIAYEAGSNNVSLVVDGLGNKTKYVYDGFGRLISTTYAFETADAKTETFDYDPSGNLTTHVTRGGQTIQIFSWRFPVVANTFGDGALLRVEFEYWKDEPEGNEFFDNALKKVYVTTAGKNAAGRCLWFERDYGLQVFDTCDGGGGRRTALAQDTSAFLWRPDHTLRSFTSPAGYRERYEYETPPAGARPSPFKRLVRVWPARTGSPLAGEDYASLKLVYNRLGQVREVHDAFSAVNCPDCAPEAQHPPVTIFSGGRGFAGSQQPGLMDVRLLFDHYDRLVEQKELVDASNPDWTLWVWHTTRMMYDTRGRVIERTAPDGQRIQFTYDTQGRNLPVQARRYPRPGSAEAAAGQVFTVDAVYHPDWDVITELTDAGKRTGSGVVRSTTLYDYAPESEWLKLRSVTLPAV